MIRSKNIISFIGKDIAEEVKTLSSDLSKSILRSDSTDALKVFTWDALLDELHRYAPVLSALLSKQLKQEHLSITEMQ